MSDFEYDVFLSHASADKAAVRELAQRLKGDGLRVWLDEWVIQPGDSIPLAIEQGLESSRTLVLVMSQAAFDSEWVTLERHTALFRDPTNQQRRFIPLRLDDCDIKDSLRLFAYIDWREEDEDEYGRLLAACRFDPPAQAELERWNDARAIKASDAFRRVVKNDPELRARMEQLRPEMESKVAALQQQLREYKDFFVVSFGESAPNSIEDWTRLATRAGLNPNWMLEGKWTPREVAPFIEGYLQRVNDSSQRALLAAAGVRDDTRIAEENTMASRLVKLDDALSWRGWAVGLFAFLVLLGMAIASFLMNPFTEGMRVGLLIVAPLGGAFAAWFISGELRFHGEQQLSVNRRVSVSGFGGAAIFIFYFLAFLTIPIERKSTYLPRDEIQNVLAEDDGSQDRLKWWSGLSESQKQDLKSVNDSLVKLEDESFSLDSDITSLFRVYVSRPFKHDPAPFRIVTNSGNLHDMMKNSAITTGGKGGKKSRAFLARSGGLITLRDTPNDATGTLSVDVSNSTAGDYLIVAVLVWGPTEHVTQSNATLSFVVNSL